MVTLCRHDECATCCGRCFYEDRTGSSAENWSRRGVKFCRVSGGVVHEIGRCGSSREKGYRALTRQEAIEELRSGHDVRRCLTCCPDLPEQRWVKVNGRWCLDDPAPEPYDSGTALLYVPEERL